MHFYLRPFTVIHPFYDSVSNLGCPECRKAGDAAKFTWKGWAHGGPRAVHEIHRDSLAIGYRMECVTCKSKGRTHYHVTTNHEFWDGVPFWKRPRKHC